MWARKKQGLDDTFIRINGLRGAHTHMGACRFSPQLFPQINRIWHILGKLICSYFQYFETLEEKDINKPQMFLVDVKTSSFS